MTRVLPILRYSSDCSNSRLRTCSAIACGGATPIACVTGLLERAVVGIAHHARNVLQVLIKLGSLNITENGHTMQHKTRELRNHRSSIDRFLIGTVEKLETEIKHD